MQRSALQWIMALQQLTSNCSSSSQGQSSCSDRLPSATESTREGLLITALYRLGLARQWARGLHVINAHGLLDEGVRYSSPAMASAVMGVLEKCRGNDAKRYQALSERVYDSAVADGHLSLDLLSYYVTCRPSMWMRVLNDTHALLASRVPPPPQTDGAREGSADDDLFADDDGEDGLPPMSNSDDVASLNPKHLDTFCSRMLSAAHSIGSAPLHRSIVEAAVRFIPSGLRYRTVISAARTVPGPKAYVTIGRLLDWHRPFSPSLPYTQRWAAGLQWVQQRHHTTVDSYNTIVVLATRCWNLNSYVDVGALLMHKVANASHSDQHMMGLLRVMNWRIVARRTRAIPISVSLQELSSTIGYLLTPGYTTEREIFTIHFRLKNLTGTHVCYHHLSIRGDAATVKINGKAVTDAAMRLSNGMIISVSFDYKTERPLPPKPKAPSPVVVYADTEVAVVMKPAFHHVVGYHGENRYTLVDFLSETFPGTKDLVRHGIIHRLDRGVSGVCIFARTLRALSHVGAGIRNRRTKRTYIALCAVFTEGAADATEEWCIRTTHEASGATGRKVLAVDADDGVAVTHCRVVERFPKYGAAMVQCRLESGKRHQIRIHLARAGLPIFGDVMYGGQIVSTPVTSAKSCVEGVMLHAHQLGFQHPDGERYVVEVTPPEHFHRMLESLCK